MQNFKSVAHTVIRLCQSSSNLITGWAYSQDILCYLLRSLNVKNISWLIILKFLNKIHFDDLQKLKPCCLNTTSNRKNYLPKTYLPKRQIKPNPRQPFRATLKILTNENAKSFRRDSHIQHGGRRVVPFGVHATCPIAIVSDVS